MRKVLTILGTTAVGKTKLAIKLSKLHRSIIISSDSRQVYRKMDIVTGKDHPDDVSIECINLVDPGEEFSVAHWAKCARAQMRAAFDGHKLPIIVGGTGLYIDVLQKNYRQINVHPDSLLRKILNNRSVSDLKKELKKINPERFASMNNSDINNKRRLVRAIEISKSDPSNQPASADSNIEYLNIVLLPSDLNKLESSIRSRVIDRIQGGAITETQELISKYDESIPSFTSIGYKHIFDHLKGKITEAELIESWTRGEISYAKRQITWFNRLKNAHKYDPYKPSTTQNIVNLVNTWYIGT